MAHLNFGPAGKEGEDNTMKKNLGVSVLTALLVVSLTACESGGDGEKQPDSEWEVLTSEVMNLYGSGDYAQGVSVAQRALQVAEQDFGSDHPNVALSLNNLAELHEAQSEYGEAEQLYKRSLEILEKAYGQDNPFLVPTLLNMASLYGEIGREDEAQRMMERANSIQAKQ